MHLLAPVALKPPQHLVGLSSSHSMKLFHPGPVWPVATELSCAWAPGWCLSDLGWLHSHGQQPSVEPGFSCRRPRILQEVHLALMAAQGSQHTGGSRAPRGHTFQATACVLHTNVHWPEPGMRGRDASSPGKNYVHSPWATLAVTKVAPVRSCTSPGLMHEAHHGLRCAHFGQQGTSLLDFPDDARQC